MLHRKQSMLIVRDATSHLGDGMPEREQSVLTVGDGMLDVGDGIADPRRCGGGLGRWAGGRGCSVGGDPYAPGAGHSGHSRRNPLLSAKHRGYPERSARSPSPKPPPAIPLTPFSRSAGEGPGMRAVAFAVLVNRHHHPAIPRTSIFSKKKSAPLRKSPPLVSNTLCRDKVRKEVLQLKAYPRGNGAPRMRLEHSRQKGNSTHHETLQKEGFVQQLDADR